MLILNLTEYSNNYLKISVSLWQYYRRSSLNDDNVILNFPGYSALFKFKQKITGETEANGKFVKIIVPLKYLSNFWRTLEMSLINCEINVILTWPTKCVTCYIWCCKSRTNIRNNRYKTLCSGSNYIISR